MKGGRGGEEEAGSEDGWLGMRGITVILFVCCGVRKLEILQLYNLVVHCVMSMSVVGRGTKPLTYLYWFDFYLRDTLMHFSWHVFLVSRVHSSISGVKMLLLVAAVDLFQVMHARSCLDT